VHGALMPLLKIVRISNI